MLDNHKNHIYEYILNKSNIAIIETDTAHRIVDHNKGLDPYLDPMKPMINQSITDCFILKLPDDFDQNTSPLAVTLYPTIKNSNDTILKGLRYTLPSDNDGYLYLVEAMGNVSEKSMLKMEHMNLELNNLTRDISKKNSLLKQKNQEIINLVNLDPLTRLYNRRFLYTQFSEYLYQYKLKKLDHIVLALADIDDFKRINDTYGHDLGDEALLLFTSIINRLTRDSDIKVRFGGDEFIILFTNIDIMTVYERIDSILDQLSQVSLGVKNLKLNATFGISQYNPGDSLEQLIKKSDLLLYEAKTNNKGHYIKSSID